jgi:hypothetical protein
MNLSECVGRGVEKEALAFVGVENDGTELERVMDASSIGDEMLESLTKLAGDDAAKESDAADENELDTL